MTVSELFDKFEKLYMKTQLKKTTFESYKTNINNHIIPTLGNIEADRIEFNDIDSLVEKMTEQRYSNTTITYVLRNCTKAFNFAVKRGYIEKNIFSQYDKPRKNVVEYTTLSFADTEKLLRYLKTENSDIFVPVLLGVQYGLRRGESIGLKYSDICGNILSVRRTALYRHKQWHISDCKTSKSRRDILLHDLTIQYIRDYHEKRPINKAGFIFRDNMGNHMTQNQLQLRFKDAIKNCDLPNIRFHDLRHTYATLMLREEVNPKIVSSVLGHADVGVTLDIYSHADVSMQKHSIDIFQSKVHF